MKRKIMYLMALLFFLTTFMFPAIVFADQPPDPGGGPGGGDPVGGGSPVGSGLIYLIVMGSIYGFNKLSLFYNSKKH
jgi:hypothetical protein